MILVETNNNENETLVPFEENSLLPKSGANKA